MYVAWVKPYLKNIQRLMLDQKKTDTPDLIVAFESSMIEIEILAVKKGEGLFKQCILMHFLYRTRPEMSYSQEYQRGPIHVGRVEITFRAYSWTDEDIENYKKMRKQEDMALLGAIDGSVQVALNSLGDELVRYLKEAGEQMPDGEKKEEPHLETGFGAFFKGFGSLFASPEKQHEKATGKKIKEEKKQKTRSRGELYRQLVARKNTETNAKKLMYTIYDHYKKHHGMLSW
jgi:hypothetical protein